MHLDPFSALYRQHTADAWQQVAALGEHVDYHLGLGLWLVAGRNNAGQAWCDPVTFADITILAPGMLRSDEPGAVSEPGLGTGAAVAAHSHVLSRLAAAVTAGWLPDTDLARPLWQPVIDRRVTAHLRRLPVRNIGDDMNGVLRQLSADVTGDILGFRADDAAARHRLLDRLPDAGPRHAGHPAAGSAVQHAVSLQAALTASCRTLIRQRAAAPADQRNEPPSGTVVGRLLAYRGTADDRLTLDEVAALLARLVTVTWETTARLITTAVGTALSDTGTWTRLGVDLELRQRHVHQARESWPAVVGWLRHTTQSVVLDSVLIPAGASCLLLVDASSRHQAATGDDPRLRGHLLVSPAARDNVAVPLACLVAEQVLARLATHLPSPSAPATGPGRASAAGPLPPQTPCTTGDTAGSSGGPSDSCAADNRHGHAAAPPAGAPAQHACGPTSPDRQHTTPTRNAMPEHTAPCLHTLQLPEIIADPSGFCTDLLSAHPVCFDPVQWTWLVSRHADVQAVLAHPGASVAMDHAAALARFRSAGLDAAFRALDLHVSFVDAADHVRLRRVLTEPVAVRHVRTDLTAVIGRAVTAAFDDVAGTEAVDVVPAIAGRVPIEVTRQLLGMHDVDLPTVRRWSLAWGDVVAAPGHVPTVDRAAVLRTVDELIDYLQQLVDRPQRHHTGPVLDHLLAAMKAGALGRDELIANLMMFTTAGSETTTNLISATIMAAADDPSLWSLLQQDPERIDDVVDEIGRLHPPTQYTARRLGAAIELSTGDVLPADASVVVMLAAANRDPMAFADPGRVRLDRTGPRPVTFGHGPHQCFGAPLARQETRAVLEQLTSRYAGISALPGRSWRLNANLRGLDTLPVQMRPASAAGR